MEKNEVKKYLLKNRELMANFSHYESGSLYYNVKLEDGLYQLPIATFESGVSTNSITIKPEKFTHYISGNIYYEKDGEQCSISISEDGKELSSDLGTTSFDNEIKASFLNRWVDKSISAGTFIKI